MADKIIDPGSDVDEIVASDTAGTFKHKRCQYCQLQWERGRPAKHLPGCPNTTKTK